MAYVLTFFFILIWDWDAKSLSLPNTVVMAHKSAFWSDFFLLLNKYNSSVNFAYKCNVFVYSKRDKTMDGKHNHHSRSQQTVFATYHTLSGKQPQL